MWFRNLPLRAKFGILTGLMVIASVIALIVGERQVSGLNRIILELDTNRLPSVQYLAAMRISFGEYHVLEARYVMVANASGIEHSSVEASLGTERARFLAAEQFYIPLITDSSEQKFYNSFKTSEQEYLRAHEDVMRLAGEQRTDEAQRILISTSAECYDSCQVRLQRIIAYNIQAAEQSKLLASKQRQVITAVAILLAVLLLATILAAHFVIGRSIIAPLQQLQAAMRSSDGRTYRTDFFYDAHDEIGTLTASFREMLANITATSEELDAQNKEIMRHQRILEVQAQYMERANASLRQNNVDLRQFMQREFLRIEELTRHKDTLISIAREEVLYSGNIKAAFQHITEQGALHLDVARVSIWLLRTGRSFLGTPPVRELELIDLYDAAAKTHNEEAWLSANDYPHYFSALETLDVIDADNAETDQRTNEFAEKYLNPLGINAMLDIPIRSGSVVIGVLCAEHVGNPRKWTLEEEIFARSLGSLILTALDAREKMRQRERLADLNRELLLVNTDLQDKNIALQNAQEAAAQTLLYINYQNQLLDEKTQELIEANKSLLEKQNLMAEVNNLLSEAHQQLHKQNELLRQKSEDAILNALSLKDENSALRYTHDELQSAYTEIKRQHELLEHQARHAEAMASEVQSKNELLLQANTELSDVYRELRRQNELLQTQAATIEEANTELQEKNMQLMRIDQEKNDMLGIVAHDLRNPLSSIMLGAAFLKRLQGRGQLTSEDLVRHLTRMEETSERMNFIITELLDLNAIETGKMQINTADIDMGGLLKIVAEDYTKRAEAKSITILTRIPDETVHFSTDGRLMRQVLDNLVSNAIKFSPQGTAVTLELLNSVSMLHVCIHDEGPGISPEDRQYLFQKFTRLTAKPTAGEHSTGLGLSIVKKFVGALGGEVRCESMPETGRVGTSFIVEFARA